MNKIGTLRWSKVTILIILAKFPTINNYSVTFFLNSGACSVLPLIVISGMFLKISGRLLSSNIDRIPCEPSMNVVPAEIGFFD